MVKKFAFRLDPVLKLRSFRAKEAKEALAQVLNLRLTKEREIAEKKKYLDDLFIAGKGAAPAADLQAKANHKIYVQSEIKRLEEERKRLLEIENLKRNELSEKMKDEKILEKLKEKKRDVYEKEVLDEENKQLDEITVNKHYRK